MNLIKEKSRAPGEVTAAGWMKEINPPCFNNSTITPNVNQAAQGFYRIAVQVGQFALDKQDPEIMRSCGSILFRAADALKVGGVE